VPLAVKEHQDVRVTFLDVVFATSVPTVVCLVRFAATFTGTVVVAIMMMENTVLEVLKKISA
jgi:hypothetical protein